MIIIVYCFASHSRIFHLFREVIIADAGLQNFGLYRVINNFKTSGAMWAPNLSNFTSTHWYFGAHIFNEMLKAVTRKKPLHE